MIPNIHYSKLKESYLFRRIAEKTAAWQQEHPGEYLYRMGIGDVTLPLCPAVIIALHEAVDDQAEKKTFHGYMPECGDPALRETIAAYYRRLGVELKAEEVFVSSGASDELGDILDLFGRDKTVAIPEPAYPAYVDANIMAGNRILHIPSGRESMFLPMPDPDMDADIYYICSPNNPTGAVYRKDQLKEWVDFVRRKDGLILFDAAYESFIEEEDIPHSIFEIPGAESCAIEICSLSKTAGFTGTRCGYTVIPEALERGGMNLNRMWVRNRTTKTNGVSYIIQRGAAAVFTEEGQEQIRQNIKVYKQNAVRLMKALDRCGVKYTGGRNAPYIWAECPHGIGSWEFFDLLLNRCHVVATPGEGFGSCGEGYIRFSVFGTPEDTEEAAQRIEQFLNN